MSTAAPSWYDVLGVEPDADTQRIRTAWRSAIADLDPTDPRFGALNRAAEVLLDADRRAAYDAELGVHAEPDPVADPEPEPMADPDRGPVPAGRRPVPGWLLVGLGVLTLLVAGAAAVVAATVPSDRAVEDASARARAAAERAIVPVLSYDGGRLEESRAAAQAHLTGDYRREYDRFFEGVISANAPSTGTVVAAQVVRSGLVRVEADRAQVFVLVDQTRTNKAKRKPVVYRNWVTVTMEKVDGDWLVAGLET